MPQGFSCFRGYSSFSLPAPAPRSPSRSSPFPFPFPPLPLHPQLSLVPRHDPLTLRCLEQRLHRAQTLLAQVLCEVVDVEPDVGPDHVLRELLREAAHVLAAGLRVAPRVDDAPPQRGLDVPDARSAQPPVRNDAPERYGKPRLAFPPRAQVLQGNEPPR